MWMDSGLEPSGCSVPLLRTIKVSRLWGRKLGFGDGVEKMRLFLLGGVLEYLSNDQEMTQSLAESAPRSLPLQGKWVLVSEPGQVGWFGHLWGQSRI